MPSHESATWSILMLVIAAVPLLFTLALMVLKILTFWPAADPWTGFVLSRIQTGIPVSWLAGWALRQMGPLMQRDLRRLSVRERAALLREAAADVPPSTRRPEELHRLRLEEPLRRPSTGA
jgi:hypothetical protein